MCTKKQYNNLHIDQINQEDLSDTIMNILNEDTYE